MDIIQPYVQQVRAFEANFDSKWSVDWTERHWEIPVFAVGIYYAMITWVPTFMKDRQPLPLRPLFALWNLLLSVFSMIGASYATVTALHILKTRGWHGTLCDEPMTMYYDTPTGFWTWLFILSKIPELFDTAFLVWQKKPVIFLHWYHHITVCLYCWHGWTSYVAAGIIFAGMNYLVHSIMYMYYFIMAVNLGSLVKPLAPLITTLQILQMVVGVIVTGYILVYTDDANPTACHATQTNARLGFVMYASYFLLFSQLFLRNYVFKSGKKSSAASPKAKTQ